MMELQPLGRADREEVMALYRAAAGTPGCTWSDEYPSDETFELDVTGDNLFGFRNDTGEIIACISIDQDDMVAALPFWSGNAQEFGEIARLCVRADWQGCGLAKALIRGAMEVLRSRGCRGARYLVSPGNEKALAAYRALNFRCVGTTQLYEHTWWCYEYTFTDGSV